MSISKSSWISRCRPIGLQAANAANMLAQGEDPMVSHRWAQENVLDIGQSEDMQKEIWNEKAQNIFFQKFMYQNLMELAQMKQAAMQPGNAGGIPGAPAGQAPMGQPGAMPGIRGCRHRTGWSLLNREHQCNLHLLRACRRSHHKRLCLLHSHDKDR